MAGARSVRLLDLQRNLRRNPLTLAGFPALLAVVASVLAACSPPPAPAGRSLLYGDSIAFESQAQLKAQGIQVKSFGGVAICDWLPDMRREAATRTVRRVYLEFVGNYFTSCVRGRPQVAAYQQDAATAVRLWRAAGVRVIWVRPPQLRADTYVATPAPPEPTQTPEPIQTPEPPAEPAGPSVFAVIQGIFAAELHRGPILQTASARPASPPPPIIHPKPVVGQFDQIQAVMEAAGADAYVDTSPLISPGRVFAASLPCRTGEQCGVLAPAGSDAARSPDGIHLCPTQLQTVRGVNAPRCSVYSTSAARFAEQVAAVR